MHALPRLSTSIVGASAVTLGLFFLMQMLISGNVIVLDQSPDKTFKIYAKVEPRKQIVEPPPFEPFEGIVKPDLPEPQTPPPTKTTPMDGPDFGPIGTGGGTGGSINFGDTDAIMVVQTHTMYPAIAEQRGIEGSALVEFTVAADGRVVDAILIEEDPEGYGFGRAALQAIVKFKFRARVVDGQTVAATGMRELFQFEMPDE